jgi:hypothetical protein
MKESYRGWLLQVLTLAPKPVDDDRIPNMLDRVFAFGGGGSGLSDEAWAIVSKLFGFEYMGSAEYEFGAPAKALKALADLGAAKKIVAGRTLVEAKHIELSKFTRGNSNYDPTVKKRGDKSKLPLPADTPVYFVCERGLEDQVAKIIQNVASGKQQCKEYPQGSYIFDPVTDSDHRRIGWLSVTMGEPFIAVKDKETFDRVVETFGVTP